MRSLLTLLLMFSLPAQTPTWIPIGSLFNTFNFSAGTFTIQYGCAGTSITIVGPQTNRQFGSGSCPVQIQQQPTGFTVGVNTWDGANYVLSATKDIPASGAVPPPPVPASITIPTTSTCIATINGTSVPCSFTIDPNGSLIITASSLGITVTP